VNVNENVNEKSSRMASWLLAGLGMLAVMHLHMLPALLAGLLIYELVHLLAPKLQRNFTSRRARLASVLLLAVLVVLAVSGLVLATVTFFKAGPESLSQLMAKMAQILEDTRAILPPWMNEMLPQGVDSIQSLFTDWLREHAAEVRTFGKEAALGVVHIVIGMVVGAMLSVEGVNRGRQLGPLAQELTTRAQLLGDAFQRIVFAQVRISVLNTTLTAAYLWVALPLFGVHLPLTKTLIALTFVVGLLPVLGNLISNTVIVVVSLSHSPMMAMASLGFLVVVHKFEYFLNARIVGARINARAWELLIAMLVMEAVFGIPGLVAAPIFYAWLKSELTQQGLL
jgi:predicted PurR-regulated permease PerM